MQTRDTTSLSDHPAQGVALNKQRVALLAALAAMLGAVPYLLFVDLLHFLPVAPVVAAVVALLSVRKVQYPATEEPTWGEWLLGGWSLLFFGSLISMEGFVFYAIFYWGSRLLAWVAPYLGWSLALDAGRIATIASAIVALIFTSMAGYFARELLEKLYPQVAGTRSPFFALAAQPRNAILVGAGLALALAAGLVLLNPKGLAFTLSLSFALLYTSSPLSRAGGRRAARMRADVARAIERLFEAAGYRTTRSPVTGKAEVDPLIAGVDYLALSGERAYAVAVKVLADPEHSVDWAIASELRTAARALQDALPQPAPVEPLLLMVGGRIDEALQVFSAEQGVKLAHISPPERLGEAEGMEGKALRDLALQLLGIPPGGAAATSAATLG
jgi:hypothetical protein